MRIVLLIRLVLLITCTATLVAQEARPPNIVLILADDLGYGDPRCFNDQSKVPTPHIDRLARQGVRLTDAHSPSSVCTPTRYGILTGRYAWRTRLKRGVLWPWDPPLLEEKRVTLPEMLRGAGYSTACIGKWHLGWDWPVDTDTYVSEVFEGHTLPPKRRGEFAGRVDWSRPTRGGPLAHGFDHYFGDDVPNFPPYVFIEDDRVLVKPTVKKPRGMFGHPGPAAPGWDLSVVLPTLAQRAASWIDGRGEESERPFFLYVPLTAPHTPIAPSPHMRGKSKAGDYGDFVHEVDWVVGQVLDALDRNGFTRDTLVVFTSDNGSPQRDGTRMSGPVGAVKKRFGHDPSRPWRGLKSDAWEGGHRVPFVARWPDRIAPATTSDQPWIHTDLYRSIAALTACDVPTDAAEDSFDLSSIFLGKAPVAPIRDHLVHHSGNGLFAIREGGWKLILGKGSGGFTRYKPPADAPPGQLFDVVSDPGETTNVYSRNPRVVERLKASLERLRSSGRSFTDKDDAPVDRPPPQPRSWRSYVLGCLDTLIAHGTDVYGRERTPLLMAVLDTRTLTSPEKPELFDSMVRLEERLHRRGERGSNLWNDQKTLKAMWRASALTGDAKYKKAADAYVGHFLDHCKKDNGLLAWGSHVHWDCFEEKAGGDLAGQGPHEILVYFPEWEQMHRLRPRAIEAQIRLMWDLHIVDKKTGRHNRHDDSRGPLDFAFSGATLMVAFAFMHKVTQDDVWLQRARLVANWHWRDGKLVPDAPSAGSRYDATHAFTNVPGLFSAALLRCHELTGDAAFRQQAFSHVTTWNRHAWNGETFWAMLRLDGTPVRERGRGTGYDRWAPAGPVQIWRTPIFSYEFALPAAQAAAWAWRAAVDADEPSSEQQAAAINWAKAVEGQLPPRPDARWRKELLAALPRVAETGGVYAEDYGRAISFFLSLHRVSADPRWLRQARSLATEAVDKLWTGRLFKGHPAKPYYEAVDGVGLLLWALLELDSPDERLPAAF